MAPADGGTLPEEAGGPAPRPVLYAMHSSLFEGIYMSVDTATVRRVARLARIKVTDDEAERMTNELNSILGFVEQLNEVDVAGVEPMTSVVSVKMRRRQDVVTDGEDAAAITANAPLSEDHFFLVPKVVE
jgi:aspartyl-tRNA(Asn)/glutamyl-tRNA(Gln) amidotransferase subunit C